MIMPVCVPACLFGNLDRLDIKTVTERSAACSRVSYLLETAADVPSC